MIVSLLAILALQSAFDNGRLLPVAAGDWTYSVDPAGSTARFGTQFLIRCDRASRRVTLNRLSAAPLPASGSISFTTDTRSFAYPGAAVTLSATDPALDALAFTRGRFVVTVTGSGSLALPFEPEMARSIEDCRN